MNLRPFVRSVRARYQLARGFAAVPPLRAIRLAIRGAIDEAACEAVSGHDYYKHPDGGFVCDFCQSPRP